MDEDDLAPEVVIEQQEDLSPRDISRARGSSSPPCKSPEKILSKVAEEGVKRKKAPVSPGSFFFRGKPSAILESVKTFIEIDDDADNTMSSDNKKIKTEKEAFTEETIKSKQPVDSPLQVPLAPVKPPMEVITIDETSSSAPSRRPSPPFRSDVIDLDAIADGKREILPEVRNRIHQMSLARAKIERQNAPNPVSIASAITTATTQPTKVPCCTVSFTDYVKYEQNKSVTGEISLPLDKPIMEAYRSFLAKVRQPINIYGRVFLRNDVRFFASCTPMSLGIGEGEVIKLVAMDETAYKKYEAERNAKRRELLNMAQLRSISSELSEPELSDDLNEDPPEAPVVSSQPNLTLKIKVPGKDQVLSYSLAPSSKIENLLASISTDLSKPVAKLKLVFDGKALNPNSTLSAAALEDDDMLELRFAN